MTVGNLAHPSRGHHECHVCRIMGNCKKTMTINIHSDLKQLKIMHDSTIYFVNENLALNRIVISKINYLSYVGIFITC